MNPEWWIVVLTGLGLLVVIGGIGVKMIKENERQTIKLTDLNGSIGAIDKKVDGYITRQDEATRTTAIDLAQWRGAVDTRLASIEVQIRDVALAARVRRES